MALHCTLGVLLGALPEEGLDIVTRVLYVCVIGLSGLESVILDADQVVRGERAVPRCTPLCRRRESGAQIRRTSVGLQRNSCPTLARRSDWTAWAAFSSVTVPARSDSGFGLDFWPAFWAFTLGAIILEIVSIFTGIAGMREGLSTSLLTRWTGFGRYGSISEVYLEVLQPGDQIAM